MLNGIKFTSISRQDECDRWCESVQDWCRENSSAIRAGFIKMCIPEITNVKFSGPATIIFWTDGDKTVVKCTEGDTFDQEKGVLIGIVTKIYGKKYVRDLFKECEIRRECQN